MSGCLISMLRVARPVWRTLIVVALACLSSAAAGAKTPSRTAPNCTEHIEEAARLAGLPTRWVEQVMLAESAGRVGAVSSAGAMGCMQLMPGTWRELTARHALGSDPFEPRANMIGGALYLRAMHDRFGWPSALAAYNAGPGRYAERVATARPLPAETRAYVARIAGADAIDRRLMASAQAVHSVVDWRSSRMFAVTDEPTREQIERFPTRSATNDAAADQRRLGSDFGLPAQVTAALFAGSRP